jgi:hypothetical protein
VTLAKRLTQLSGALQTLAWWPKTVFTVSSNLQGQVQTQLNYRTNGCFQQIETVIETREKSFVTYCHEEKVKSARKSVPPPPQLSCLQRLSVAF